jgi:hypothetical protein
MKFEIGGMWEESEWEVALNHYCSASGGGLPCKHCVKQTVKIETRDWVYHEEKRWTKNSAYTTLCWWCPRVIIMRNDGGFGSTGLCLDCVLEVFRT